jgi:hypothetical protein
MAKVIPFSALSNADLIVDAVYEGGSKGNAADDVLGKLIRGSGNQGGFRQVGRGNAPRLAILYSTMDDPDWPDFIDVYTGVFTYFGDNKKPGFDLHDTPRRGNKLLQSCFGALHGEASNGLESCRSSSSRKARSGAMWSSEGLQHLALKAIHLMIWWRSGAVRVVNGSKTIEHCSMSSL